MTLKRNRLLPQYLCLAQKWPLTVSTSIPKLISRSRQSIPPVVNCETGQTWSQSGKLSCSTPTQNFFRDSKSQKISNFASSYFQVSPQPPPRWHYLSLSSFCRTRSLFLPLRQLHSSPPPQTNTFTAEEPATKSARWISDDSDSEPESGEARLWFRPLGEETGIMVRNSLSKTKEPLILKNKMASWYMCGPTVYDEAHIGHASSYVRFDVIRRILTDVFGISVVLVLGVTDIDDKIINRAKTLGQSPRQLAKHYEGEFFKDLRSLNVSPPTFFTRVSDYIPEIISFIQTVMAKGHAYSSNGSVYFDVKSVQDDTYPKLTRQRNPEEGEGGGGRVSERNKTEEKKDARDFAMWKAAKPNEPSYWESPWGPGRPGWHIECSAMASRIFGTKIDIHSGGIDLMFPHHENEISQCYAYHSDCHQWVNYWLHTGSMTRKDEETKMSKSLNNTVAVSKVLADYSANQFRTFCLLRHYRSGMQYSKTNMDKAAEIYHTITSFLHIAEAYVEGKYVCEGIDGDHLYSVLETTKSSVTAALADDFDTPTVMHLLLQLIHEGNVQLSKRSHSTTDKPNSNQSPLAVMAANVAYVNRLLHVFGMAAPTAEFESDSGLMLKSVMDSLVHFRSSVRTFAMSTPSATPDVTDRPTVAKGQPPGDLTPKEAKRLMRKEREPLLQACDALREELTAAGIQVLDQARDTPHSKSSWKTIEKKGKDET